MYDFDIFLDFYLSRGNVNSLKSWVEYLFPVVDGMVESLPTLVLDKRISKAMKAEEHENVILEEDDGEYERGDTFLNSHL